MKRLVLVSIVLFGCVFQGFAQQGKNRQTSDQKLERITSRIETEMDLNEEKMEEVKNIYQEFFITREKQREAFRSSQMKMRTGMIENRNQGFKEILTEDEYDQLIALMETPCCSQSKGRKGNCRK